MNTRGYVQGCKSRFRKAKAGLECSAQSSGTAAAAWNLILGLRCAAAVAV